MEFKDNWNGLGNILLKAWGCLSYLDVKSDCKESTCVSHGNINEKYSWDCGAYRQTNPRKKWGWLENNAKGCLMKRLC